MKRLSLLVVCWGSMALAGGCGDELHPNRALRDPMHVRVAQLVRSGAQALADQKINDLKEESSQLNIRINTLFNLFMRLNSKNVDPELLRRSLLTNPHSLEVYKKTLLRYLRTQLQKRDEIESFLIWVDGRRDPSGDASRFNLGLDIAPTAYLIKQRNDELFLQQVEALRRQEAELNIRVAVKVFTGIPWQQIVADVKERNKITFLLQHVLE
jgi:hypothetical protein